MSTSIRVLFIMIAIISNIAMLILASKLLHTLNSTFFSILSSTNTIILRSDARNNKSDIYQSNHRCIHVLLMDLRNLTNSTPKSETNPTRVENGTEIRYLQCGSQLLSLKIHYATHVNMNRSDTTNIIWTRKAALNGLIFIETLVNDYDMFVKKFYTRTTLLLPFKHSDTRLLLTKTWNAKINAAIMLSLLSISKVRNTVANKKEGRLFVYAFVLLSWIIDSLADIIIDHHTYRPRNYIRLIALFWTTVTTLYHSRMTQSNSVQRREYIIIFITVGGWFCEFTKSYLLINLRK